MEYLKNKQHFELKKTCRKGYEFTYQKLPQQMLNFLHEEKVYFCKIISLYTINNLCVVIEIYSSSFLWFENDVQKNSF